MQTTWMNVNVVIIGHVDHGKSTLIGRLIYDSDSITEGRVEEIQELAEEYKKRFEFAYFLDSFDDEIKEERTIDTTKVIFKGKNLYTLTDVPGHKQFIKNMLTGASHADVAVLIVAADEGILEQTRRHVFLIHLLGIKKLIVVINKMDVVGYSEDVFQNIKEELTIFLSSFGYLDLDFIPGSAMEGDNIYQRSERMGWYHGATFMEALDSLTLGKQDNPLRFLVQDIYTVESERIVVGRVASGVMKKGDDIIFQPSGSRGTVDRIMLFQGELDQAEAGDSIGIMTSCEPKRGDVCGSMKYPPLVTHSFLGEAVLLSDKLSKGERLELRCGTQRVRCEVQEILEKISSETNEVIGTHPDYINEHEAASILFATEPVVMEKFADIPELGRFVLVRDKNIGAGVVLNIPG